jgi:hypothetical protein
MSVKIKGSLAAENGLVFLDNPDPNDQLIPRIFDCLNVNPIAIVWLQPIAHGGQITGYEPIIGGSRPSVDAVKTIKVENYNTHDIDFIAVEDSVVFSDFADMCNECCGDTPEFAAPTIPVPIIEEHPCPNVPNGTPTYTYQYPILANPNTLKYLLSGSFNGAYPANTPDTAGYTNEAAVLAFAQDAGAGWGNYGTWTIVTPATGPHLLQLVSTTTKSANVVISLLAVAYCMDIPTPDALIDTIVIGADTITFPAVTLSRTTPEAAFYAIRPYLTGDLQIVTSSGHKKFQYTGLQVPHTLKLATATVATFTAGVCGA